MSTSTSKFTKGFETLHTTKKKAQPSLQLGHGRPLSNQQMELLKAKLAACNQEPSRQINDMNRPIPKRKMVVGSKPFRKSHAQIKREQQKINREEPLLIPQTRHVPNTAKSTLQEAYLAKPTEANESNIGIGRRRAPVEIPQVFLL